MLHSKVTAARAAHPEHDVFMVFRTVNAVQEFCLTSNYAQWTGSTYRTRVAEYNERKTLHQGAITRALALHALSSILRRDRNVLFLFVQPGPSVLIRTLSAYPNVIVKELLDA